MKPEKIFKRYDIRGEHPEELDEEFMVRIGKSLGSFVLQNYGDTVVVCQDNKKSSSSLKDSLVEGLISTGIDVLDAGTGPTDLAAFHGSRRDMVSAQVTSSHMPLDFNGLKLMYPEGNGFVNEDLDQVQDIFSSEDFPEGRGEISEISDPQEEYVQAIKSFLEGFNQENRKIVVETLGGAAKDLLPRILRETGFEVVDLAEEHEEQPYFDPPNPTPDVLEHVPERVKEEDADMAVATDMDADRVAVFYGGEWISGDDLFCLFSQVFGGKAVASIDTSEKLEEFADEVYYTRVGDPFVVEKMIKEDAAFSGEPNGHYCFPRFVNYNSGILAACLIAGMDLESMLTGIADMNVKEANVEVEDKEETMERVIEDVRESYEVISDLDGVKFRLGDSTVLVRPSGSSSVIRVKSEAESPEDARYARNEAAGLIRENI